MKTSLFALFLSLVTILNAQSNWIPTGPPSGDNYYSICTTPDSTYFVAAFNPGKILKSTDNGNTWVTAYSNSNYLIKSVYFIDNNIGFAGGNSLNPGDAFILKTVDGGNSWSHCTLPYTWSVFNSSINDIVFYNGGSGLAVGHFGVILSTSNYGTTWQHLSFSGTSNVWNIGLYNRDTSYYASSSGLYYKDPNNNFLLLNAYSFSSVDRGINDIFAINNSNVVAFSNGSKTGAILAVNPLPANSVQSILAVSDSTVFIAGNSGKIYISRDGAHTFNSDRTPSSNTIFELKELHGTVWAVGTSGLILKRQLPVGQLENKKRSSFAIHPNPVKNILMLDTEKRIKQVLIFNAKGEVVKEYSSNQTSLDVSSLANGIYFIKLNIEGAWNSTKFLKK